MSARSFLSRLRRGNGAVSARTRDEQIAELLAEGFLEPALTKKSRGLLAEDVTEMNNTGYWCDRPKARRAQMIVAGIPQAEIEEHMSHYGILTG